jgi:hypothetical protein
MAKRKSAQASSATHPHPTTQGGISSLFKASTNQRTPTVSVNFSELPGKVTSPIAPSSTAPSSIKASSPAAAQDGQQKQPSTATSQSDTSPATQELLKIQSKKIEVYEVTIAILKKENAQLLERLAALESKVNSLAPSPDAPSTITHRSSDPSPDAATITDALGSKPAASISAPAIQRPLSYSAALRQSLRPGARLSHAAAARICFQHLHQRPLTTTFSNLYIRCYLPQQKAGGKRYELVRGALRSLGITQGVFDMSFIGKSITHLLVDAAFASDISAKLGPDILLSDFDPLAQPAHTTDSHNTQRSREAFVDRIAILLSRNHGPRRTAILSAVPVDLLLDVERSLAAKLTRNNQRAAASGARIGGRAPAAIDHGQDTILGEPSELPSTQHNATLKRPTLASEDSDSDGFQGTSSRRNPKKALKA